MIYFPKNSPIPKDIEPLVVSVAYSQVCAKQCRRLKFALGEETQLQRIAWQRAVLSKMIGCFNEDYEVTSCTRTR